MKKRERVEKLFQVTSKPLSALEVMDICGFWSFGGTWITLWDMEKEGLIIGIFEEGAYPRRMRYHKLRRS